MSFESLSQHFIGREDQKLIGPSSPPWGVICAGLLAACGTTPIEAVVADGPEAPAAWTRQAGCDEPSAGRFALSVKNACLRQGAPLAGAPAFASELSADCTSTRAQWDLTPALAGTFTLRNAEDQLSLDVRGGSDVPGAPIIIDGPNTVDNQRFWLRPRPNRTFELAARHAPNLCAEAHAGGLEIWPCASDNMGQAFRLARAGCF